MDTIATINHQRVIYSTLFNTTILWSPISDFTPRYTVHPPWFLGAFNVNGGRDYISITLW
jgi:hypothetical protein